MVADFEKTSFGIQRRQRDAERITAFRQVVVERRATVTDISKLIRLDALLIAIDAVLEDLKD